MTHEREAAPGSSASPERPHPPRSGPAPYVAAVLVVVIVVVGAALVGEPAPPPAATPVALQPFTLRLPLTIDAIDSGAPPVRPASTLVKVGRSAAPGTESVQVCGGEWVTVETDAQGEHLMDTESARVTRARTLERLRASPSEFDRAIGAWLGAAPFWDRAQAAASAAGCQGDTCVAEHAFQSLSPEDEALARAAVGTTDPRLYALAYPTCWRNRTKGSCALLSPQQWARIDPGNATPWLYAMQVANEANDAAARDEALYRIATSEREHMRYFQVADRIIEAAPTDDASLLGTSRLVVEAVGRVIAQPTFHHALIQRCRVKAEADPNTWQLCAAAAERLAEHSDSSLGQSLGIAMGRILGMPADRFDRAQGEIVDATRPEARSPFGDERSTFDCGVLRRDLAGLRLRASMGEVEASRAALGASAASPDELLRLGRERRLQREAQMRAQAASAATEVPSAAQAASR